MSATVSRRQRWRRQLLSGVAHLPVPVSHRAATPPARVLIMRPDHLGDVLLVTPTLARLRATLADCHIALAVGPWAVDLVRHGPPLDAIVTVPFPPFDRGARAGRLAPYRLLLTTARRLRAARYDAVLILRPDYWWGALLAKLAGIPRRIGYAVPEVAPFLTEALPLAPGRHAAALNLALADRLIGRAGPADPISAPLIFRPTVAEHRRASQLLAALPAASGPLIAIQPGAGASLQSVKLWPTARWQAVALALADGSAARIVLTGSSAERALTGPIVTALAGRPVIELAGQTDLGVLGAVFAACDLVLGVDSGGLHLATATAPRSLRLYGPSDPATYGPWGAPQRHRLIHQGLRCPLCHNLERTQPCVPDCMGAISVAAVLAQVVDLLGVGAPGPRPD